MDEQGFDFKPGQRREAEAVRAPAVGAGGVRGAGATSGRAERPSRLRTQESTGRVEPRQPPKIGARAGPREKRPAGRRGREERSAGRGR